MDHNYFTSIGPFVYGDYVTFKEGENKGKKLKIVDAMEVMSTSTFQPIIRYGINIDGKIRYADEDEIIPYEMYKDESNKNSDNIFRVKIVNKSKFPSPAYATKHSAGMDIRANIEEDIEIKPFERVFIPTGLYIALPNGYEAQLRPRSGLACKHGITVANAPGTIN